LLVLVTGVTIEESARVRIEGVVAVDVAELGLEDGVVPFALEGNDAPGVGAFGERDELAGLAHAHVEELAGAAVLVHIVRTAGDVRTTASLDPGRGPEILGHFGFELGPGNGLERESKLGKLGLSAPRRHGFLKVAVSLTGLHLSRREDKE
jgi:hypothetical protein